ncbi:DUF3558 family protein [Pseudonocardia sp. KRD291]|uniref:DUF3558 family protein n=1 Tax=Pseudonocardia sp. KRD291 TaxID=2792007 RepID=UPI001C49E2EF|nr:DUF3558 family protein [Pseudonocardia sp. KRD291]MBW0105782.1 DUF3558 family protein [Pseudonocardia sp. KRD291]
MRKRIVSLSLLPVVALALGGCGSSTPSGPGASPAAAASSADWSGVDPCSLVPEGSRAGLGLGARATPIGGPAPSCRFPAATRSAAGLSVGTQVIVGAGFAQVVTNMEQGQTVPRVDTEIAGRTAAQFEGGDVICTLVVDVSGSAAVAVIGTDGCDAARRVAETVVANGPGA